MVTAQQRGPTENKTPANRKTQIVVSFVLIVYCYILMLSSIKKYNLPDIRVINKSPRFPKYILLHIYFRNLCDLLVTKWKKLISKTFIRIVHVRTGKATTGKKKEPTSDLPCQTKTSARRLRETDHPDFFFTFQR